MTFPVKQIRQMKQKKYRDVMYLVRKGFKADGVEGLVLERLNAQTRVLR